MTHNMDFEINIDKSQPKHGYENDENRILEIKITWHNDFEDKEIIYHLDKEQAPKFLHQIIDKKLLKIIDKSK